jgi:hypothetical protein
MVAVLQVVVLVVVLLGPGVVAAGPGVVAAGAGVWQPPRVMRARRRMMTGHPPPARPAPVWQPAALGTAACPLPWGREEVSPVQTEPLVGVRSPHPHAGLCSPAKAHSWVVVVSVVVAGRVHVPVVDRCPWPWARTAP